MIPSVYPVHLSDLQNSTSQDTELPASDKYNLVWHSSSPPFYSSQTAADLQDLAGFSSQEPYYPLGATGTSKDKRASSSVPTTLTRTNNVPGATANYPLHSPAHTDDQNDDELPVDLSSIDGTTSRYYSAYPTPVKYSSTRDTPGSYAVAHDDKVQIAGLTTHVDPAPGYDGSSSGWGRRVRPASVVSGVSVGSAHPSYISNDSTRSRANND